MAWIYLCYHHPRQHYCHISKKKKANDRLNIRKPIFITLTMCDINMGVFYSDNGKRAIVRARLIAFVNLRWYFADVPVTRRGRIFPRSETNRLSKSTSL